MRTSYMVFEGGLIVLHVRLQKDMVSAAFGNILCMGLTPQMSNVTTRGSERKKKVFDDVGSIVISSILPILVVAVICVTSILCFLWR
jgi:hypothetical protein